MDTNLRRTSRQTASQRERNIARRRAGRPYARKRFGRFAQFMLPPSCEECSRKAQYWTPSGFSMCEEHARGEYEPMESRFIEYYVVGGDNISCRAVLRINVPERWTVLVHRCRMLYDYSLRKLDEAVKKQDEEKIREYTEKRDEGFKQYLEVVQFCHQVAWPPAQAD